MLDKHHRTSDKPRERAPPTLASPFAGERQRGPTSCEMYLRGNAVHLGSERGFVRL